MIVATYRMLRYWPAALFAGFAILGVGGVVVVVVSVSGHDGPPTWFVGLWLLALAWNGYWWLFRIAYRLDLTQTDLAWRAPLRQGSLRTADLVEMRPYVFGSSIEVIVPSEGAKVLVLVRKGFVDFMREVETVAPQVRTRVGLYAKLSERLPGARGYSRRPQDPSH